jgi:hypothetical protein
MLQVVELELWSRPGMAPLDHSGKQIANECCAQLQLDPTVVLGLSFVSDETDVTRLRVSLETGEATAAEFHAFCSASGLPVSATHEQSAASFLAQRFGQPLAWLHIPYSAAGKAMYIRIAAWADARRLVLVETSTEICCPVGEPSASHYWHAVA